LGETLGNLGIPDLTSEQLKELCAVAEEAARQYVTSKVPGKRIERLDVSAEVQGTRPVSLEVDVDIGLSPTMGDFDAQRLADEAVKEGFKLAEKYLRDLACHSQR